MHGRWDDGAAGCAECGGTVAPGGRCRDRVRVQAGAQVAHSLSAGGHGNVTGVVIPNLTAVVSPNPTAVVSPVAGCVPGR